MSPIPILRKLSGRQSLAEMADILERHVSAGADDCRCVEARDALRRVRKDNSNFYVRAALRCLDQDDEPCACVRKVIDALRKFGRMALR